MAISPSWSNDHNLGLHDALIHLMARLAAFIFTDRERKISNSQEQMPPPPVPQSTNPPIQPTHSASTTPTSTWSQSSPHSSHTDPQLQLPRLNLPSPRRLGNYARMIRKLETRIERYS